MNTQLNAMKQALEALEIAQNNLAPSRGSAREYGDGELWDKYDDAITALRARLEQPEQEPVAAECKFDREQKWVRCEIEHHKLVQSEPHKWPGYQTRLLYTTPPYVATPLAAQRQWVGLTDEEIRQDASWFFPSEWWAVCKDFARTIESELKEKNSG